MIADRRFMEQEECFARAFASGNIEIARPPYHSEVVYVSVPSMKFAEQR